MFETPVRFVAQRRNLVKGAPSLLVVTAAERMAERNVGAILVVDGTRLSGIVTERDIVFRVVAAGLDPAKTRLRDIMTSNPTVIEPDRPFGQALLMMHEGGYRHLPVVEGDRLVGIVSARNALDPELEDFTAEASRRRHLQSSIAA